MKHLATLFALLAAVLIARGEPPTPPSATARSVTVDTNGLVRVPANLWEATLGLVSVKEARFGAKGDGSTDDTAPLQAAFDAAEASATGLTNGMPVVYLPGGTYRITSTLIFDNDNINARGPVIIGDNAKIVMDASNVPIIQLASSSMSYFRIKGLQLSYASAQDATKTSAYGLHFNGGAGESFANGVVEDCVFANCYAGIVKTTTSVVWNCRFANLRFVDVSKFAVYFPNTGSGSPGNRFENLLSLGNNLSSGADALFYLQGQYGYTVDGINADELIDRPLLYLAGCYNGTLSGVRVEKSGWSTDGRYVVGLSGGEANVFTGIELQSCTNATSTVLYGVRNLANGTVKVQSFLLTSMDCNTRFKTYSAAGGMIVGAVPTLNTVNNFWGSQAVVESGSQSYISVVNPKAGIVSANRGDADVTLTSSDAEIQLFATALSANRTVTLPASERWHGMRFTITKSSNTGTGKLAVGSVYTIQANKAESVTVVYDVSASWRVEKVSPLNTGAIQLAVTDFGARGDNSTDDSSASQAAIDAAAAAGGGTVYFPPGQYLLNVTLGNTADNVRLIGERGNYLGGSTSIKPANTNNPCITIGGDTAAQYTAGVTLENLFFEGAVGTVTRSATGVKCTGGAFEITIRNCGFAHFAKGLDIQKGVNQSCNLIYLDKVMGRPDATDAANRGIYVYGTDGTPIVNMVDCHIGSSGSLGYSMEIDGATVYMANSYFDLTDDHGILLSKSASSTPRIYCANASFDAQASSDEVFTGFDDSTDFKGLIIGTYTCDGNFKYTGGSEVPMSGSVLNGVANLNNPMAYGSLWFSEGTGTNQFDYAASGSRITVNSSGLMQFLPTLGLSTTKYLQFADNTASPTLSSGYAGLYGIGDGSKTLLVAKSSDSTTNRIAPFVGDTGSGGQNGLVPAPAAGDAAAEKTLGASGGWVLPKTNFVEGFIGTLNVTNGANFAAITITNNITYKGATEPTTDAAGETDFDTDAWAASRGTIQFHDGTSNVYVLSTPVVASYSAGKIPVYDSSGWFKPQSADEFLSVPTQKGSRLVSSGTSAVWTTPANRSEQFWEFLGTQSTSDSFTAESGGGSMTVLAAEVGHDGIISFVTDSATDYPNFHTYAGGILGGGGLLETSFEFKIPTLSDSTNEYQLFLGFADLNTGTNHSDAACLYYNRLVSTNWQIMCRTNYASAAAETITGTAVEVTTGWHTATVQIAADGQSGNVWIDSSSAIPFTGNIPNGSGRGFGIMFMIYRSNGTAGRYLYLDWCKYYREYTSAR